MCSCLRNGSSCDGRHVLVVLEHHVQADDGDLVGGEGAGDASRLRQRVAQRAGAQHLEGDEDDDLALQLLEGQRLGRVEPLRGDELGRRLGIELGVGHGATFLGKGCGGLASGIAQATGALKPRGSESAFYRQRERGSVVGRLQGQRYGAGIALGDLAARIEHVAAGDVDGEVERTAAHHVEGFDAAEARRRLAARRRQGLGEVGLPAVLDDGDAVLAARHPAGDASRRWRWRRGRGRNWCSARGSRRRRPGR